MTIAAVEGEEIVIRIPFAALTHQPEPRCFLVTDPKTFAPHVAREIGGEDMSERLWIEPVVEDAITRAAESDAPGIKWDDCIDRAETEAMGWEVELNDKEIETLERVANALRGVAMDHRIPAEARDVLTASAGVIDAVTENHLDAKSQVTEGPIHPTTEPPRDAPYVPRPFHEWHEDYGDVLWWCWDGNEWLGEAPYVGTPLDLGHTVECHTHRETGEKPAARFQVGGWPGYHTHWTPLPVQPHIPQEQL